MHKKCGIYKITSPTGKIYIGQSVDIDRRFRCYVNLHHVKSQRKLHYSLLKHGAKFHQYSGELINSWDSLRDIKESLGFDTSAISKVCRGKLQSMYNFKWQYLTT